MADASNVVEVTQDTFAAQVVEQSRVRPVLVDFWAPWCGPCRMLAPVLDRLAEHYGERLLIAKVNTDTEKQLAQEHGIRSIPNLKLYRNGEMVEDIIGGQPEADLRVLVDRHVVQYSDPVLRDADAAYQRGDVATALALLEEAAALDAGNPRIGLRLARVQLGLGDFEAAARSLQDLPAAARESGEALQIQALLDFARLAQETPDDGSLSQRLEQDPNSSEARFHLAVRRILDGDYETALEQLLDLLQRDRGFRDGAPRESMLKLFSLLGEQNELVHRYRTRMFAALH
ncbi:MAG TPA: thioredoxin [Gammaproteobacteria bacterium]|nr:thioredoxin [Gammaproteobacteria bacterium]